MRWYHACWLYPLAFVATLPVFFTEVAGSLVEAIRSTRAEALALHRRFAIEDASSSACSASASVSASESVYAAED